VIGLWLVRRANQGLPWLEEGQAPDGQELAKGTRKTERSSAAAGRGITASAAAIFGVAAAATLAAGVVLERSSEKLAQHAG
jgi:cation:H+ antiporter